MTNSVNCWHFKADIAAKIIIINFHISKKKKILIKIYQEPKSIGIIQRVPSHIPKQRLLATTWPRFGFITPE